MTTDPNAARDRGRDQARDKDVDINWVSDEELQAAMEMERTVFGRDLSSGASLKVARQLFQENAAAAAQSIIKTAIHGSTEKVRFDAAKYVLERALGPASQQPPDDSDKPLEAAMKALMGNSVSKGADHPG
jgi:hypothetical protein